jgi:hypothetical protein
MADLDGIHLKLDRILAGQQQVLACLGEQKELISLVRAGIEALDGNVQIQTEVIERLSEAVSEEDGGGGNLVAALAQIAASLRLIQQDGARMVVQVGRLPNAVAQAAQDAVLMAMGEAVTPPPGDHHG